VTNKKTNKQVKQTAQNRTLCSLLCAVTNECYNTKRQNTEKNTYD